MLMDVEGSEAAAGTTPPKKKLPIASKLNFNQLAFSDQLFLKMSTENMFIDALDNSTPATILRYEVSYAYTERVRVN